MNSEIEAVRAAVAALETQGDMVKGLKRFRQFLDPACVDMADLVEGVDIMIEILLRAETRAVARSGLTVAALVALLRDLVADFDKAEAEGVNTYVRYFMR